MPANFKDVLTLVVNADTKKAQAGIGGMKSKLIGMIGVFAGFAAAKKAFSAVIDAAAASEKVYKSLGVAIDNSGRSFADLEPLLRRFTGQVQRTTGISDELVAQGVQMATQFGIDLPDAMRVTNAALDLAAARNISLTTAVDLLGKAFVGDTALLKRYGIIIDESIPKADKFEAVMAKVNKQFGGQAAVAMETYAGKVALLGQRWGDFLENVGEPVTDVLSDVLDRINSSIDATELSISWWEKLGLSVSALFEPYDEIRFTIELLTLAEKKRQDALDAAQIAGDPEDVVNVTKRVMETGKAVDQLIETYRNGTAARVTFSQQNIRQIDLEDEAHKIARNKYVSREQRAENSVRLARQQTSIDFEESEARKLALFTDFATASTDIVANTVAANFVEWSKGRVELGTLWQNMADDFVQLFVNTILNSVKVKAVAGIVGILGSIFDKPANDATAINQGRHYAELWQSGAIASFSSFVPQIANTPAVAIAGTGAGFAGGGSLNIINPIVSSRFFAESRSSLETMARRNNLQLSTRRVSAMQVTAPRFI